MTTTPPPSQPQPGESQPGQSVPGPQPQFQAHPTQPTPGQPMQGQPMPGQPVTGQTPGQPFPVAQKPKKPWYLRWWSITIAVVFVLCCSGGVIGALSDDSGSDNEASETTDGTDAGQTGAETGEPAEAEGEGEAEAEAEDEAEEEEADYFSSSFPVFDAVTESGSGDSVITLPAAQGIITASHSGSSNFILTALDENNEMTDLPVNAIGSYDGTTAYGLTGMGGDAVSLEITAGGSWEITIAPIADAPELGDPQESHGDGVYRYTGGAANWKLTHDGAHNFIVTYVSDSMFGFDLIVNEIGSYDGTSAVTSGPAVVVVNADGDWTIGSA